MSATDEPIASVPPSRRLAAGAFTAASFAVWALWAVCLYFVVPMAVKLVVEAVEAVF